MNGLLITENKCAIIRCMGNQSRAAYPLFIGGANPPDERKEGLPMITYSDFIQTGIFIVALVGLCYQIFKGKRK